jgi:hypothetical protein
MKGFKCSLTYRWRRTDGDNRWQMAVCRWRAQFQIPNSDSGWPMVAPNSKFTFNFSTIQLLNLFWFPALLTPIKHPCVALLYGGNSIEHLFHPNDNGGWSLADGRPNSKILIPNSTSTTLMQILTTISQTPITFAPKTARTE